jgi:hypothetical protein
MTSSISPAPELIVQTWYNTDRPLLLSGLRGRVVVLVAFQVLCPKSLSSGLPQAKMRGTPSLVLIDKQGLVRKHTFGPVDDLRIGAEIGALTQEGEGANAVALTRSSAA